MNKHARTLRERLSSQRSLLFLMTLGFVVFGVLMVANVSVIESTTIFGERYAFAKQQALWGVLGIIALLVTAKIPSSLWMRLGPLVFIGGLLLLIAVLIPGIGTSVGGARRWIVVAGFTFQPVEAMKMGLLLYLATWLQRERRFLSFATLLSIIFGLIILQPDLGSALIIASIAAAMYFVSGKPIKHFVWLFGIGTIGILILILIAPYRLSRLTSFLNPNSDPLGKSYHIRQITLALGNGGLFGQGLGKSKQKYRYIPEAATDSIFAIIAEEFGFVGSTAILFSYAVFFWNMGTYVRTIEDTHKQLVGVGVLAWLSSQTMVNIASITALIPLTGVPLPFISYGGSSLVTTLASVGILLGLSSGSTSKTAVSGRTNPRKRRLFHRL